MIESTMRKYFSYFDLIICVFLIGFFSWHIFNGKLGLIASNSYKKQLILLEKKHNKQVKLQKKLKNDIASIGEHINIDYLETQALKSWYKVPKDSKILRLSN